MSNIGSDQQELTATNAKMTDDQAYIKDLTEKCNLKSREWDQHLQMRQDELTALTTALTTVKSRVTAADEQGKTVRLVEKTAEVSKIASPTAVTEQQDGEVSDDEIDGIVAGVISSDCKASLASRAPCQRWIRTRCTAGQTGVGALVAQVSWGADRKRCVDKPCFQGFCGSLCENQAIESIAHRASFAGSR